MSQIGAGCFSNATNLTQINIKKAKGTIAGAPWGATIGNRAIKWEQ